MLADDDASFDDAGSHDAGLNPCEGDPDRACVIPAEAHAWAAGGIGGSAQHGTNGSSIRQVPVVGHSTEVAMPFDTWNQI